jgi:hypothetical protein
VAATVNLNTNVKLRLKFRPLARYAFGTVLLALLLAWTYGQLLMFLLALCFLYFWIQGLVAARTVKDLWQQNMEEQYQHQPLNQLLHWPGVWPGQCCFSLPAVLAGQLQLASIISTARKSRTSALAADPPLELTPQQNLNWSLQAPAGVMAPNSWMITWELALGYYALELSFPPRELLIYPMSIAELTELFQELSSEQNQKFSLDDEEIELNSIVPGRGLSARRVLWSSAATMKELLIHGPEHVPWEIIFAQTPMSAVVPSPPLEPVSFDFSQWHLSNAESSVQLKQRFRALLKTYLLGQPYVVRWSELESWQGPVVSELETRSVLEKLIRSMPAPTPQKGP